MHLDFNLIGFILIIDYYVAVDNMFDNIYYIYDIKNNFIDGGYLTFIVLSICLTHLLQVVMTLKML